MSDFLFGGSDTAINTTDIMTDMKIPKWEKSWRWDTEHTVIQSKGCSWMQMKRLARDRKKFSQRLVLRDGADRRLDRLQIRNC